MLSVVSAFVLRLLVASLVIGAFFVAIQDFLVFPLLPSSLIASKGADPAVVPEGIESHFLRAGTSTEVETWFLPAPEESEKFAILFHGNGDLIDRYVPFQQFFAALGFSSLTVEYRAYKRSRGWTNEEALTEDALAAWSYLREEKGAKSENTIVYGISMGSGPAVALASEIKPRMLLLLAAYTSLDDVVRGMALYKYLTPFLWTHFPNAQRLAQLNDLCVVAGHGKQDGTIPFSHHSGVVAAQSENDQFVSLVSEDAGHNDIFGALHQQIAKEITSCFVG